MDDIYEKEKRSEIMSSIKSKGNKSTELKLIQLFREAGIIGWKRGYPVKGHPDFVFLDKRIAIFVDGCFWHGHSCKKWPTTNEEFWNKKIKKSMEHDKEINAIFEARGWTVLRFWECELKRGNLTVIKDTVLEALAKAQSNRSDTNNTVCK